MLTGFLDCLDEIIEKAPQEVQTGLKEVFGYAVIHTTLFNTDFIKTTQSLVKRLNFQEARHALSQAMQKWLYEVSYFS